MVAAAVIGSAVVGGVASSMSSSKAAKAQSKAASQANDTQLQIYERQRQDAAPWRDAGKGALSQLTAGTTGSNAEFNRSFTAKDFVADPGYTFRMQEGQKALERSAAARGGLLGGATAKALTKYSQGVASDEYQNAYNRFNADKDRRFNRLSGLAGTGQAATQQLASAGQNYANAVNSNTLQAGNAQAASSIATGNAINNVIGTGVNAWAQNQYMNQLNMPTASQLGTYAGGGYGGGYTSAMGIG